MYTDLRQHYVLKKTHWNQKSNSYNLTKGWKLALGDNIYFEFLKNLEKSL